MEDSRPECGLIRAAAALLLRTQAVCEQADELRHAVESLAAELDSLRAQTAAANVAARPPLP